MLIHCWREKMRCRDIHTCHAPEYFTQCCCMNKVLTMPYNRISRLEVSLGPKLPPCVVFGINSFGCRSYHQLPVLNPFHRSNTVFSGCFIGQHTHTLRGLIPPGPEPDKLTLGILSAAVRAHLNRESATASKLYRRSANLPIFCPAMLFVSYPTRAPLSRYNAVALVFDAIGEPSR